MPLMLVRFLCPSSFWPSLADGLLQLGDALVQAANLIDDDLQLQIHQQIELHFQHCLQPLLAGQRFLLQIHAVRRAKIVDLVLQRRAQFHHACPASASGRRFALAFCPSSAPPATDPWPDTTPGSAHHWDRSSSPNA